MLCRDCDEEAIGAATAQDGGRGGGLRGVLALAEEEIHRFWHGILS